MKQLTEKEAENFLEKEQFDIVARKTINSSKELEKIDIDFPWVMKASGKNINHKKKMGAIQLNIKNVKEAKRILENLKKMNGCEEIIVQKQVKGEEFIIGLKNTSEFGLAIMLGKGGSKVEEEKDTSFRITPITKNDAKKMFRELKSYKIMKGKIKEELLVNNLLKLSELAQNYKDIVELDINPLIINKKEAKIVDARMIFN
ncbi:acetyl-CoA synthetase [Candidatus Pacearchaeota archaeon]|nr:acetyl-CoA synthetase [Candidatus Pacearchaeota archaeon]